MTTLRNLAAYVAALAVAFVLAYALGDLTGVRLPAGPPDGDGMSEMTSTDH